MTLVVLKIGQVWCHTNTMVRFTSGMLKTKRSPPVNSAPNVWGCCCQLRVGIILHIQFLEHCACCRAEAPLRQHHLHLKRTPFEIRYLRYSVRVDNLPMLLPNHHPIHILHILRKPPLALLNQHIIPTHLPLPHPPILRKRPILQPITPLPLHSIFRVLILIPIPPRNSTIDHPNKTHHKTHQNCTAILSSANANISFLNR